MRPLVLLAILCSLPSASALQTPSYWEAEGYAFWYAGDALCEGALHLDALRPLSLDDARTDVHAVAEPSTAGCASLDLRFTSAQDGLDAIEEDWGCDARGCYGAALAWDGSGEGAFSYRADHGDDVVEIVGFVRATRILRA